ncbi:unnamed protein product [Effrenium voratum]|uniref:Uncharacterized protein n=1 Tax=Effrenium voratum TaxID=2562239 RepID=A0AA36MT14_9DINO|nr:unnamed protein product [Effrenium voratum]CAJ1454233.1 unnamed protein product [Effrenium voratum]
MPLEMMSAPRLEAPWDRLEFQEQSNVEAYCAELDRMLSMCHDGHAFVEHVAALDQRFQEAWFSTKFGDRHADPMQAFRQVPTGGVVHGPRTNASALGAQGSEILQRHASLLENRYPRPSVTPRFEAAAGAGAFSRPTAAGPSRCRESAGGEVQQTVHSSCCRLHLPSSFASHATGAKSAEPPLRLLRQPGAGGGVLLQPLRLPTRGRASVAEAAASATGLSCSWASLALSFARGMKLTGGEAMCSCTGGRPVPAAQN